MSEQPIAPIRQSSFSDAVTIGALNTKLAEANALLAKWKISILGDVVADKDGFAVKLNIFNGNEQGFIYTITPGEVAYYESDPANLVDQLVELAHIHLLKQLIRNELVPFVSNGIRNAALRNAQSKKS